MTAAGTTFTRNIPVRLLLDSAVRGKVSSDLIAFLEWLEESSPIFALTLIELEVSLAYLGQALKYAPFKDQGELNEALKRIERRLSMRQRRQLERAVAKVSLNDLFAAHQAFEGAHTGCLQAGQE